MEFGNLAASHQLSSPPTDTQKSGPGQHCEGIDLVLGVRVPAIYVPRGCGRIFDVNKPD